MKMTYAAAIALAAYLAAPTVAQEAHEDAPSLYAAQNELAQLNSQIKDEDMDAEEASASEELSMDDSADDTDEDDVNDDDDMDTMSEESETDELAQVGQNNENPQSTSRYYKWGNKCSKNKVGNPLKDFCGADCEYCQNSFPADDPLGWRSAANFCRCAPPQRPATDYVYKTSTLKTSMKGLCRNGCACYRSWPAGEGGNSPEAAFRCAPANATFI